MHDSESLSKLREKTLASIDKKTQWLQFGIILLLVLLAYLGHFWVLHS